MNRRAGEPFTWHPVWAPGDITGWYIRVGGVGIRSFNTEREARIALASSHGFVEIGTFIRDGAEPLRWDLDDAFELAPVWDERTGRGKIVLRRERGV